MCISYDWLLVTDDYSVCISYDWLLVTDDYSVCISYDWLLQCQELPMQRLDTAGWTLRATLTLALKQHQRPPPPMPSPPPPPQPPPPATTIWLEITECPARPLQPAQRVTAMWGPKSRVQAMAILFPPLDSWYSMTPALGGRELWVCSRFSPGKFYGWGCSIENSWHFCCM